MTDMNLVIPKVKESSSFNIEARLKQHQSVTKLITMLVKNLVTPKAAAKLKPTSSFLLFFLLNNKYSRTAKKLGHSLKKLPKISYNFRTIGVFRE